VWFTDSGNNAIVRLHSGNTISYAIPTTSSMPMGITSGPDGALWFAESAAGKIGEVTTSGTFTEYVIPTGGSGVLSVTPGPNNTLWFTEPNTNKIGVLK
jgi:virginiamycin B lyase